MMRSRVWIWIAWVTVFVVVTAVLRVFRAGLDTIPPVLVYMLLILGGSVGGGRPLGFTLMLAGFLSIDVFFQAPYDWLSVVKLFAWLVLLSFMSSAAVTTHLLTADLAVAAEAARRS